MRSTKKGEEDISRCVSEGNFVAPKVMLTFHDDEEEILSDRWERFERSGSRDMTSIDGDEKKMVTNY